jgi:uncharacterized protein YceK
MRILVLLAMMSALSGCTAMMVGGSAESGKPAECSESEKEAEKRGC